MNRLSLNLEKLLSISCQLESLSDSPSLANNTTDKKTLTHIHKQTDRSLKDSSKSVLPALVNDIYFDICFPEARISSKFNFLRQLYMKFMVMSERNILEASFGLYLTGNQ